MSDLNAKPIQMGTSLAVPAVRSNPSQLMATLIEWITQKVVTDKKSQVVPRARAALSLITHLQENDPKIESWIYNICRNMLHSYLEYFLGLIKGAEQIEERIDIDRHGLQRMYQVLSTGQGVVLAGVHSCGYDYCIYSLNQYLPCIQILSKANPTGGKKLMLLLRKLTRTLITPLSVSTIRKAAHRLQSGGIVAVAIDMPVDNGERFQFFNQSTPLTNAHARMAVKNGAAMFLVYTRRMRSGQYRIDVQEVTKPEDCCHKKELVSAWAQRSYQQLEHFILRWPDAWYGSTFELFPQA